MSNFETETLRIRKLPNSTQSFEKMFDEMADNKTDIASINTELFNLSPDYNAERDDRNRIDKTTDSFIMKIAKSTDIINSTISGNIEHNDSNLSSIYVQFRINPGNRILGGCSSTQESLCTECRFDNRLNSLLASNNNTQRQTQSSCFQCEMKDQYNEERFLQIRSLSLTPEKRKSDFNVKQFSPSQNRLKKFKSEGCPSTIKNTGNKICKLSIQDLTNIDQTVEPFSTFCSSSEVNEDIHCSKHTADLEIPFSKLSYYRKGLSQLSSLHQVQSDELEQPDGAISSPKDNTKEDVTEILIDEKTLTDNKSNNNSLNERIVSQSQNLDANESDYSSSTLSQRTIEEIYYIDVADDIGCLTNAKAISEMPEYQKTEEKSAQSIINEEIIQGKEIIGTTAHNFGLKPLIILMPNEIKTRKNNPLSLSCKKDLESETCSVNDEKTAVNLKIQCPNEAQLNWIERQDEIIAKDHPFNVSVTNVDSGSRNEEIFKVPDDSILEITIESDSECIVKQDKVIKSGKINSVHAVEDLKKNSTNSKTVAKDKRDTRNRPIDLTVNTNRKPAENVIPVKDIGAENDGFDTSFLTELELVNIERQIGMAMQEVKSVNPAANITSIKDPNILSKTLPSLTDDLSLEFLSESELQRIEEDAYIKAKKTNVTNLMNVNTKSLVNKQDVFYRPEQLNIINENTKDDLVMPNWVTNPAPEPNYEKIKRAVQMRREFIKKMLDEILRLSNIVSKVGSIVYAKHQNSDLEAVPKGNSQIQDSRKSHCTEKNETNRSEEMKGASGNAYGNSVTADSKDSDIFYVPQSNGLKYNAPPSIVPAPANTATIITHDLRKNVEGNGEFYTPQLNRFKHDIPPIFNCRNGIKFNKGNVSYVQSNASNIFGSLKHDFIGNESYESDNSSVWYRGRVNETGILNSRSDSNAVLNKENLGKRIKTEHCLPKIVSNGTIAVKDEIGLRMNKVEPVYNDTIFYLPDKLSSGSNNYTVLPGGKNSKTLSSVNFTKLPSTPIKVDEPRPLNFGKSSAPRVINNDDSIFYNGNKKRETTFDML